MVSADSELPPLDGVSFKTVALVPLPMVSEPLPVMPAMTATVPVTVTAPLFTLDDPTLTVVPLEKLQLAPTLATPPAPLGPGFTVWRIVTPLVVAEALTLPPTPLMAKDVGVLDAPPVAVADAVATPEKEVELAVAEAVALPPLPEE